jgi:hypothetical protein
LHALGKTYGILPGEIYAMDYDIFDVSVQAYKAGAKAEKREMDRLKRQRKK